MIYSLTGTLLLTEPYHAVVECGGVGFSVKTSLTTLSRLPKPGAQVTVLTHMNVREDAIELFGFADRSELELFKLLISVSGVGPKAAVSILSGMDPERLALCIASGDVKALKAPGVGPKIAQRVILELKDKVSAKQSADGMTDGSLSDITAGAGNASEAAAALEVLGYSRTDATKVIARLDAETSVEEMIKYGLKALAGKV